MMIDNNYSEYPTIGLNGAKVTVAHEFHHSIQLGIIRETNTMLTAIFMK